MPVKSPVTATLPAGIVRKFIQSQIGPAMALRGLVGGGRQLHTGVSAGEACLIRKLLWERRTWRSQWNARRFTYVRVLMQYAKSRTERPNRGEGTSTDRRRGPGMHEMSPHDTLDYSWHQAGRHSRRGVGRHVFLDDLTKKRQVKVVSPWLPAGAQ